jgi:predicted small lipoprotein YifL
MIRPTSIQERKKNMVQSVQLLWIVFATLYYGTMIYINTFGSETVRTRCEVVASRDTNGIVETYIAPAPFQTYSSLALLRNIVLPVNEIVDCENSKHLGITESMGRLNRLGSGQTVFSMIPIFFAALMLMQTRMTTFDSDKTTEFERSLASLMTFFLMSTVLPLLFYMLGDAAPYECTVIALMEKSSTVDFVVVSDYRLGYGWVEAPKGQFAQWDVGACEGYWSKNKVTHFAGLESDGPPRFFGLNVSFWMAFNYFFFILTGLVYLVSMLIHGVRTLAHCGYKNPIVLPPDGDVDLYTPLQTQTV